MTLVSYSLPDDLVQSIDKTAQAMNRSPDEVICKAVELYLGRAEELWSTLDRISADQSLAFDWDDVEGSLLAKD